MKETVELEDLRKINEIRRFSNKELRLTNELIGTLLKSSEYCGTIRRKSCHYVWGIVEGRTIFSSMRTQVIVSSTTNKL